MTNHTTENTNVNANTDVIPVGESAGITYPESSNAVDTTLMLQKSNDSAAPLSIYEITQSSSLSSSPFTIYEFTPKSIIPQVTQSVTQSSVRSQSVNPSILNHTSVLCYSRKDVIQSLYQENPRKSSSRSNWRNYTLSLESYEKAVKKEYQLLLRNLDYTRQYPNFHIILLFRTPMSIERFSVIRGKAFGSLVQNGVKGYYVHEPGRKHWMHIHALAIFDGTKHILRKTVKEAFTKAGLEYGLDFRVKVKPVDSTDSDYRRLCSYILKFSGRRVTPRVPILFLPGLRIRKVGMIGRWFAKPKKVLWQEYLEKLRQKHTGQIKQITPGAKPILSLQDNPSITSD